MSDNRENS